MGLVNAHISTPSDYSIEYAPLGHYVRLHRRSSQPVRCAAFHRGDVNGFSRQSRKRLLQLFGQIDTDCIESRCSFITLTYPATYPPDPETWHRHLNVFLTWLCRRWPQAGVIWRLELQERGAPHFHLLAVNAPYIPREEVTEEWRTIAHEGDQYLGEYATKIMGLKAWKQAAAYVSKYVSKVQDCPGCPRMGRCWGVRQPENIPMHTRILLLTGCQYAIMYSALLSILPDTVQAVLRMYNAPGFWSMLSGEVVNGLVNALLYDSGCVDPPEASASTGLDILPSEE